MCLLASALTRTGDPADELASFVIESYLPRLAVTLGLPTLGAETPAKDRVRLDLSLSVGAVARARLSPDT